MFRVHNKNNIFIVNFEHISHLFLEFLLLILSKQMLAGQCLNKYLQNQCGRTFSYNFFQVNSQNPYLEEYVWEPCCCTIDINNEQLLRATLKKIKDSELDTEVVVRRFSSKQVFLKIRPATLLKGYSNKGVFL